MPKFSLLILCAGFGSRMLNLTNNIPKPLLKFKNKTFLGNTINFFKNIGCNEFFINTHYNYTLIEYYIRENFSDSSINLIYEPVILGTGGGIKNIFNYTKNKNICVVNSDIFWQEFNKADLINSLKDINDVSHCKILLSKKNDFFGLKKDKGDFSIQDGIISNWYEGEDIIFYSGFQIVSKEIFKKHKKIFPMNEVWNSLIINKNLKGSLIDSNILHVGDKKSYEEL